MATKKRSTTKTAMEVGAGVLAAAAVAGAGYYFYGDKNAKKHRQAASKWAKSMKQDVVREVKKAKRVSQKDIARIVDKAAALYEGARSVDKKDLRAAAAELKKNWALLRKEVSGGASKAKKAVKKVVKKAKKTAKKAAPKKAVKKASKKAAKRSR